MRRFSSRFSAAITSFKPRGLRQLQFKRFVHGVQNKCQRLILKEVTQMAEEKGKMTVSEAGRKGGKTTAKKYGREFYEEIGHKGGQKVKELIERGKQASR